MQAAVAEALPEGMPMPADMIANNEDDQPENQIDEPDLVGEMMQGFDRLQRMSHTELRDVIASRVALLKTNRTSTRHGAQRWKKPKPPPGFWTSAANGRKEFITTSTSAVRWLPSPARSCWSP